MPIPHDNPAGFGRIASAIQFYDILVALAAFVVGSAGTYKLYVDEWYGAALAAAAGSVVVCVASVVRAVLTYKREAKKQSLHELYGCLGGTDMADKPITTESSKEHEEITRVTVSNVGAAIYVEEITVPRALREAMERQFERASPTLGTARGHFEKSAHDPNDFDF